MQRETTREKLLESASREFLPNDYQEVPLRIICRNASVTTNALYFFFKDKSASFHTPAKDAAEAIMQILCQHTNFEEEVHNNIDQLMDMEHGIRFAQGLISFYYAYGAALELLFSYS